MIRTTAECAGPEASLRQRAEAQFLKNTAAMSRPLSSVETEELLHELQVHQIELEMQNDELRRSQAELDTARADYFDLYDLAPVGYLTVSKEGLIQKANLCAATMLGVVRNFLFHKPLPRFIFPEDQDVYFQRHKRLTESGELQNGVMRLKRADGSPLWVLLQASLTGNEDVRITFTDDTEHKLLETANKLDLEYTENIVETVREPLLVLDSDLKILSANGSFYATFKVTPEETIGEFIYDLGNRQWDIPKLRLFLENILFQNSVFNDYEVDHVFKSIGHKTILLNARQIFRKHIGSNIILLAMEDITERKLLETNIQNVLEYAENIVETVREPLIVLDSNLKIISVNGCFYHTFKVTPKETIGKYIYDLGNRQWDIPKLRQLLETILPTNTAFNDYEVDHVFQSVGHRTFLLNARQIFRKDIGSHIILLAMQDVTERKQKALALDERTKELSCLYSIISLCNLPDIQQDELFTKTVMRIPSAWQFPEITEASIETDGHSFQTNRFRETPWMLVSDITVHGTSIGQLKLCYLEERQASDEGAFFIQERHLLNAIAEKLGQKIERIRAETEMRKLSRAVEQSPVSIIITDTQGTIEFINPKFTELTGYTPDEAIGQNPRLLKSGKTPPETHKELWETISTGKTWEGEFVNKRKDGSIFYEHATISALRDTDGAITHYLAVKEDITEKKSTMEQLIQSQKMESIGQLAGGLAHDLNNILSVVNGYAGLAQIGMDEDQKVFTYLSEITRASSRAASLTHSLLAYSRKQEMSQQRKDLNLLIETVGSFIKRIIHDNIRFTLSLQADPLCVYVDTVQIEQVLLNLATNARDAMPNGGIFRIETKTGCIDEQFIAIHGYGTIGPYAIITVTDSGHGMDAQTKLKVFDPFFTTKEVGKGTGLGLSMVMGIIRQHGGFVHLKSEPGTGSTFELYLPLVDTVEIAAETTERTPQMEQGAGTILLAEDDADTRSAVEEFLTRAGYTVITAVDGQDAVEKFANHTDEIDLVISDVVMPRKSGKTSSDEIRQMSERVKFIFVSGHANDIIEREGGFGADVDILEKPLLPYELLKKIRAVLEK